MALLTRARPAQPAARFGRGLAWVVLAAAAACVRVPDPIEPAGSDIQVHGMLEHGADTVMVLVARTAGTAALLPVTGASPVLVRAAETLPLVEAPEGTFKCMWVEGEWTARGCYFGVLPGGIAAGDRFELALDTPDGARVTGRAVVPAPPELLAPAPDAAIELACDPEITGECRPARSGGAVALVPLTWRVDEVAGRIHARPRVRAVFADGMERPGAGCGVAADAAKTLSAARHDSLDLYISYVTCSVDGETIPFDSVAVDLRVTAFDTAYARYAAATEFEDNVAWPADLRAGLTGAYGFFAGAATATRRLILRR